MLVLLSLDPWRTDALDVAAGLGSEVQKGLTSVEASVRLERFGANELDDSKAVPKWRRFTAQLADPSAEVVPGDVLLLAEGDAVSADAAWLRWRLCWSLKRRSPARAKPFRKISSRSQKPSDSVTGPTWCSNGTAITSGRGRAVVTATGMNTEMGTIARLLGNTADERTPLQQQVNQIGRQLGIAIVVIAVVVVGAMLFTTDINKVSTLVDVLLIGVSLAIAAVPEGLPAILSVVLARGVQRMARQHAIVNKLSSVETLGSASIVCSDKTHIDNERDDDRTGRHRIW
jgi:P-type Ca2+ transporter type 2C